MGVPLLFPKLSSRHTAADFVCGSLSGLLLLLRDSLLHTWNQKLELHPHARCVVPAGGLSPGHTRWVPSRDNYFLPKQEYRPSTHVDCYRVYQELSINRGINRPQRVLDKCSIAFFGSVLVLFS
jgi:hypothetical protein